MTTWLNTPFDIWFRLIHELTVRFAAAEHAAPVTGWWCSGYAASGPKE